MTDGVMLTTRPDPSTLEITTAEVREISETRDGEAAAEADADGGRDVV